MADNTAQAMYLQSKAKVKTEEGGFAKGTGAGIVSSVVRGAVAIPALARAAFSDSYGLEDVAALDKDTRNLIEGTIDTSQPGVKSGFDFGNIFGDVAQTVLDPVAGVAKATSMGAAKAGLMLGLLDKGGNIRPQWAAHHAAAVEALTNKTKTAMQVWQDHGLVNLNQGVKDAPIELARYFGLEDLRVADGAIVDASGMPTTYAEKLYNDPKGMPISAVLTGTKLFDDDEYKWLFDRSAGGSGYTLRLEDLDPHTLGYHDPSNGSIVVNRKLFDQKTGQFSDTGIRTLAHEIQHAIQLGEDWVGKGNNAYSASKQVASVENAIKARLQRAQDIAVEKTKKVYEKYYWPLIKEAQKLRALYDDMPKAKDVPDAEYGEYLHKRGKLLNESYAASHKVAELLASSPFANARHHLESLGIRMPVAFGAHNVLTLDKDFSALKVDAPTIPYDAVFKFYENDIGEVWARVAGKTHYVTEADMASRAPWRFMERTAPNIQSARNRGDVGFFGELLVEESAIVNPFPP